MGREYDFAGWATRSNIRCSDGRTITDGAFANQDGAVVPLVWNHQHNSIDNVLGKAYLQHRNGGMYAYCTFNDTPSGMKAKETVQHGDVVSLSIFANRLKEQNSNVQHGVIREVSLVLAGANPGAYIENVMSHDEGEGRCAVIYNDGEIEEFAGQYIEHADNDEEEAEMADRTIQDIVDEMTDEQKQAMYAVVEAAVDNAIDEYEADNEDDDDDVEDEDYDYDEEDENVTHNVFDEYNNYIGSDDAYISHADQEFIINEAKSNGGSLKNTFLSHAATYGVDDIEWLFPEYQNMTDKPGFINVQPQEWVNVVMKGVHHTPFSRIKSMFADIREDEARARGYIKGNRKVEEVFSLLKRTTDPQTIYKKQKLDRDDVVDITDFDVVSWIKGEMRMKLDEEIARAILVGDGRLASSDDHIQETHIRPIAKDDSLYTITKTVVIKPGEQEAHALYTNIIRSFNDYQGSGNPIFFTSQSIISDLLLLEDGIGRRLFNNISDLATTLRVSRIVPFPYLPADSYGIIVNLGDYNVGADKGGSINMFEDFDIDYNQQKYLIETRCSGALTKPYSAIVLKKNTETPDSNEEETPNSDQPSVG